jgi:transposase
MSNSSRSRRTSSITVVPHETIFVGIDVHSRSHHVTLWGRERGLITHWVQPADAEQIVRCLVAHRDQIALVVHEAGPTGFGLVRTLRAAGLPAEVVAPSKIPLVRGQAKCDRLDSRQLAEFASQGLMRPIAVPTPQQEADREIVRARGRVVIDVRRAKQQIRSFALRHGLDQPTGWGERAQARMRAQSLSAGLQVCQESLLAALTEAQRRLRVMRREVADLATADRHAVAVGHLRSVPGVGLITAMVYRTELFAPERFACGAQVAAFVGLAPHVRASGARWRADHIGKTGNGRLRTALVEAAWQWVRRDSRAAVRYRRLLSRSASGKKAIVAMARRLAILLWTLSVRETDYHPCR